MRVGFSLRVGFYIREETDEMGEGDAHGGHAVGHRPTLSVVTLWAAPPRFLIPSEATRHHPDRSEPRHLVIPIEAKRRDLLFAWILFARIAAENCGIVKPRLNDTDERSSELCRRHSRNGNRCRDLCLFRTRACVEIPGACFDPNRDTAQS
jgi:hypothetical protein